MNKFDYFVVFAEMRTGSNFLEENINQYDGLECHGEAYNPNFVAYPSKNVLFGITPDMRNEKPFSIIGAVKQKSNGLGGFRYFHDHDPRVFDTIINDPRCAKVILTRNPLDSFVSWKIAQETGQWKLTNATHARAAKIDFRASEFQKHLETLQAFQLRLLHALQTTGQTAFYISYEDTQDLSVLNGLARFLGVNSELENLSKRLKKQNPSALSEKINNFEDVEHALVHLDQFNIHRTPNFEPRRGPSVPSYIAAAQSPLLFLPIKAGPTDRVGKWLAQLDQANTQTGFNQKSLRKWKRQHDLNRSFTVLRHPLARAYDAFCKYIYHTGPGSYVELRRSLCRVHNLPLPNETPGADFSANDMRQAFVEFLKFLKMNLSGQTAARVDAAWASQFSIIQGFSEFAPLDYLCREEQLDKELEFISHQAGVSFIPLQPEQTLYPFALNQIYDDYLESLARDAYQKDFGEFGFQALYQ